jgi:flagellar hook protein FlgE
MFVLNSTAGQEYTRDGAFTLNSSNQLVTSGGQFVQGYGVDANGNILNSSLQNITIPVGQQTVAKATQNASFSGNLNSGGVVASGATILTSQAFTATGGVAPTSATLLTDLQSTATPPANLINSGDVLTLAGTRGTSQLPSDSLTVTATTTVSDLQNFINQALGIDTSVVQPGNPTPGATLQTSGTTGQLTIVGNTGTANTLTLGASGITDSSGNPPFTMGSGTDGTFTNDPAGEGTSTSMTMYDSLGTPITVNLTTTLESESSTGTTWQFYANSTSNQGGTGPVIGNGTITFNTAGQYVSSTGSTISIDRAGTGANTPLSVNLDFSSMTAFASNTSNMVMTTQDGEAEGTLASFSVGSDGTITGGYTNGLNKTIGQVALAIFNNPLGLQNTGSNVYSASADSGAAQIGAPGDNGTGTIRSGSLEESNVDISKEFIDLIMASTGFSAASRVISTSDQLLTDLLNSQH